MEKKTGTTRTVYIFKYFVIKLPLIKIVKAYKHYMGLRKNESGRELMGRILQKRPFYETAHLIDSVRGLLFTGIVHNWCEFWFCVKHGYPVYVAPTFFSFFGLFNIQKYGKRLDVDLWKFRLAIDEITQKNSGKNAHVFYRPVNFCEIDGHVQCVDYGSHRTQEVLLKYGERIYNELIV